MTAHLLFRWRLVVRQGPNPSDYQQRDAFAHALTQVSFSSRWGQIAKKQRNSADLRTTSDTIDDCGS